MFTGLVRDVGTVASADVWADGAELRISTVLSEYLAPGGSVAVNGVCLTAKSPGFDHFTTDVMNQTLKVTALDQLESGSRVNIEPAMRASDRLDGHIVQGHVDGVGEVILTAEDGLARRVRVGLAPELMRYVIERGSIVLDGVSLTVAGVGMDWFEVSLIPETLERTTLSEFEPGRKINVECDVIAKYVERIMGPLAGKEQA